MKSRYLIAASLLALAGPLPFMMAYAADPVVGEEVLVTSSRLGQGIAGASTSTISAEDIKRSPAQTLPDLLSLETGVQTRDLYGGIAGAQATVDIRGFGSSAKQNTLILVNGRKINDFDLSSIDWASIPLDSIQRVEVIRGNAGSVLYGDGAVGGVINIVTKAGTSAPGGSIATSYGSYATKKLEASAATGTIQGFSANAWGSYLNTNGYRDNNDLIERNFVSELRHGGEAGDWFVKLGADDQTLGLPGVQRIAPSTGGCPAVSLNRRSADTPLDKATLNSVSATVGHSRTVAEGVDVVLDAGVRRKDQEAQFIDACFGSNNFNSTQMTTWSITPRVVVTGAPMGLASTTRMGFDLYYVDYQSERRQDRGNRPTHIYSGYQANAAAYALNEVALTGSTDLSLGARFENSRFTAGDTFDAGAPGAFGSADRTLDQSDSNLGINLGLEQKVMPGLAIFGRTGRGFRTPNIDERIGATGVSLFLKPQWSWDVEGGVRAQSGPYKLQSSVYRMAIRDEIHFIASTFTNVNLDPTRRLGWETSGEVKLDPAVRLKGSLSYINAKFTAGRFDGNDVPLVAPWSGNVAAFWDIMPNLHLAGIVNAVAAKRLDNDEANFQTKINGYWTADLKIGGEYGAFNWSAQVNNIFDRQYFTYGVASATTAGRFNIYPLPERSYLVRAGVTF